MIAYTKPKSHYLVLIISFVSSNLSIGTELQFHMYQKDHKIKCGFSYYVLCARLIFDLGGENFVGPKVLG